MRADSSGTNLTILGLSRSQDSSEKVLQIFSFVFVFATPVVHGSTMKISWST